MDSIPIERPNFFFFLIMIGHRSNIIKEKKEIRIQVFTMVSKEKTTESEET